MTNLTDGPKEGFLPLDPKWVRELRQGDEVVLTGTLYAFRDAVHRKLCELITKGEPIPINLQGQTVYYMGPSPAPPGRVIGSAGPTTSGRMDRFVPLLMENGLLGMIGKGPRSSAVTDAIMKHGGVYFAAPGGAGALLSKTIAGVSVAAYPELEPEALLELQLEKMPVTVVIDSTGGNFYQTAKEIYGAEGENALNRENV